MLQLLQLLQLHIFLNLTFLGIFFPHSASEFTKNHLRFTQQIPKYPVVWVDVSVFIPFARFFISFFANRWLNLHLKKHDVRRGLRHDFFLVRPPSWRKVPHFSPMFKVVVVNSSKNDMGMGQNPIPLLFTSK